MFNEMSMGSNMLQELGRWTTKDKGKKQTEIYHKQNNNRTVKDEIPNSGCRVKPD